VDAPGGCCCWGRCGCDINDPMLIFALVAPCIPLPFPCPEKLGDATLDVPALPPGVPGSMMDPNCGCCVDCVENVCDMDGRVAVLTAGGPLNVVDPGPNKPASSIAGCAIDPLPLEGSLSSKSMSDRSVFVDAPPSSGGIGFDEKE
jgi:hypothetical protein